MNEADRLHEEKLKAIMENAESLKGKEYIDYLLAFLKGKKDENAQPAADSKEKKKRKNQICHHEFTKEDCKKLTSILNAEDMVYYFSVSDGMKLLVDSLHISTQSLKLLQDLLENHSRLQDDFQRQHLYEGLIDFM